MSLVSRLSATFAQIAADLKGTVKKINAPVVLTGNLTLTAADSGTHFFYNGASTITLTFPASLPVGFSCRVSLASQPGKVLFDLGGRLSYGNAARDALIFQWDVVDILLTTDNGNPVFLQTYNLALPVLYAENSAAFTRNVTAMSAVPGMSLPIEKNAAYDVQILVNFTSAIITNSLKVGLLALPTGATCQLECTVWTSKTPGGTPNWSGIWTTSAEAVAGLAGNASATGVTMLASIRGRVRTGATAGALALAAGAMTTTGVQTVAVGGATMSVSKVYDQDRT